LIRRLVDQLNDAPDLVPKPQSGGRTAPGVPRVRSVVLKGGQAMEDDGDVCHPELLATEHVGPGDAGGGVFLDLCAAPFQFRVEFVVAHLVRVRRQAVEQALDEFGAFGFGQGESSVANSLGLAGHRKSSKKATGVVMILRGQLDRSDAQTSD